MMEDPQTTAILEVEEEMQIELVTLAGGDRSICQVCGKIGHRANMCNFRYDEHYTETLPNQRNGYGPSRKLLWHLPALRVIQLGP